MPDEPRFQRALEAYIDYFEKLNARSVRLIEKLAVPGMQFRDPFNDVAGIEKVEAILQKMFVDVQSPEFTVRDYAWGQDGRTAYIKWRFTAVMRGGKTIDIEGVSEIYFNDDALVMSHIDHWDPALGVYEKIPLLGNILRRIKARIAA